MDTAPPSASVSAPPVPHSFSLFRVLLIVSPLAAAVFVVIGVMALHYKQESPPIPQSSVNFGPPVENRLDPRFTDADGDLVADAPTDPAKQIDPPTLVFAYIPTDRAAQVAEAWKPFLARLKEATGKEIVYQQFKDDNEELTAMRDGKLHVAGFATGSVPIAVNLCGFVPDCSMADETGSTTYKMEIIVPADSPAQTLPDLRGNDRCMVFARPTSNSGFKAPLYMLRQKFGMIEGRDYRYRFSGGHEPSILMVAEKQKDSDAAAVASSVLVRMEADGRLDPKKIRTVFISDTYPNAALGHVYNLKPELAAKIKATFESYSLKDTDLSKELSAAQFKPIIYKDSFALVRAIDNQLGNAYAIDEPSKPAEAK